MRTRDWALVATVLMGTACGTFTEVDGAAPDAGARTGPLPDSSAIDGSSEPDTGKDGSSDVANEAESVVHDGPAGDAGSDDATNQDENDDGVEACTPNADPDDCGACSPPSCQPIS